MNRSNFGGLLRKHWLLVTLFFVSHLITAATIYGIVVTTNTTLARDEATSKAALAKLDTQIKQLNDQRAAKAKADHAAAALAAEQSKSATVGNTTHITCINNLTTHNNPATISVLVNKTHCLSPIDFAPSDLTSVNGYMMSAKIAPHLQAMMAAAASAGVPFGITSAYRSYDNQVVTYNGWVTTNGSTAAADTVSARPGYSEHQTGLAVDLDAGSCVLECLTTTPQYAWLQQHAAEFGFIQRYIPGYETITGYHSEAWHYRYVGAQVAQDMKTKGIKTLEQYWNIPGGDYPG